MWQWQGESSAWGNGSSRDFGCVSEAVCVLDVTLDDEDVGDRNIVHPMPHTALRIEDPDRPYSVRGTSLLDERSSTQESAIDSGRIQLIQVGEFVRNCVVMLLP